MAKIRLDVALVEKGFAERTLVAEGPEDDGRMV